MVQWWSLRTGGLYTEVFYYSRVYTGWFNGGHLGQVVFIQRCFITVECILDGSIVVT